VSLIQFLRILWARRLIIAGAAVSCLLGGIVVLLIVPPRYEAHSRVLLNLLKPDPVTGQVIGGPATRTYVATQKELIEDYSVAERVVDQLHWLSNPQVIEQFNRTGLERDEFSLWAAKQVIDRTNADVVEGSNILEITYSAASPVVARDFADALRQAYIDASLSLRRADANRNAEWYSGQAEKARAQLEAAEQAKAAYERANNIVMQADNSDVDSARLRALAGQTGLVPTTVAPTTMPAGPAAIQLAQLDAQILQASQTLGPNHPELKQLRAQRAAVAKVAAQDAAAARSAASAANGAASASMAALDRAVAAQKARVIAERDKLGKLAQLQAEVDLRRDQFNKTSARAAELRQEAAVADTGLTPLGVAAVPQRAAFPNVPLIIFGSLGLGLAVGVLVALLIELLGRRVRGAEDLLTAVDVPLLAVVSAAPVARRTLPAGARRALPAPGRRRIA